MRRATCTVGNAQWRQEAAHASDTRRGGKAEPPCATRTECPSAHSAPRPGRACGRVMLGNCSPNRRPAAGAGCAVDTVRVSHESATTEPHPFSSKSALVTACCSPLRRLYHLRICHSGGDSSSEYACSVTAPFPPRFLGPSQAEPGGASMTLG